MTDTTIEVRDEEFNAEEALEATEKAIDEEGNVKDGAVQVGDTVIHGDNCTDNDVYITDVERGVAVGIISAQKIIDRAEDAIPLPFENFVEDEFRLSVVNTGIDTAFHKSDIDVTTNQGRDTVGCAEGKAIDDSDDVQMTYITYGENGGSGYDNTHGEDDELLIGLEDTRDDEAGDESGDDSLGAEGGVGGLFE